MNLIKAGDYGLEEQKAQQISSMFDPMLAKMIELEKEYNIIVKSDISEKTIKSAKDLRLKYVKVRTGTAAIHKELKNGFLLGGRFVDGWKNAQLMASQGIEEKLMNIEKHYETLEKKRIEKLQIERKNIIAKYYDDEAFIPGDLGLMQNLVWDNFLFGMKANYEAKKEAERKQQEEIEENKKKEVEEQKRLKLENEKLKEAEEKAIAEKKEAEEKAMRAEEAERKAIAEKKEAEEKAIAEKKEAEEKAIAEKKEAEEKAMRAEEAERKAIAEKKEAEEKAMRAEEAERKAIAEKEEAELNKGDQEKVKDLINDLQRVSNQYVFKSIENLTMYSRVKVSIEKIIKTLGK